MDEIYPVEFRDFPCHSIINNLKEAIMTFFTKRKIALCLCLILVLSLTLGGCEIKEDSQKSRELCEAMLDNIIKNDYTSAYGMIQESASQEEFEPLWHKMRDVLKNSKSYELEQKSWHKNFSNGVTTVRVLFEVITDDGKICQMSIITSDGMEGLYDLGFLDSTEFVQKTEFLNTVNVFLYIFSLVCFAFSIWMLIDCLKRRPKHKILWAILTLCYAGISVKTDGLAFAYQFRIDILSGVTNIISDRTALAITVTVLLPIGAIVYFIMRKRLTLADHGNTSSPLVENADVSETPDKTLAEETSDLPSTENNADEPQ